jgi:hypothetical protein
LNPIEEFFAELKAFIKKEWHEFEENPHQDFKIFLEGAGNPYWAVQNSVKLEIWNSSTCMTAG